MPTMSVREPVEHILRANPKTCPMVSVSTVLGIWRGIDGGSRLRCGRVREERDAATLLGLGHVDRFGARHGISAKGGLRSAANLLTDRLTR